MRQTSSAPEFLTSLPAIELPPALPCGCGVDGAGHDLDPGIGVDPVARNRNLKRLRRIEGQVRGLQKMIQDGRYCTDILTQVSSVHEALRAVGRELMRGHIRYSAALTVDAAGSERFPDEIIEMIYRAAR